eukprot:1162020-Pelagomonas_calceolata.AAC.20
MRMSCTLSMCRIYCGAYVTDIDTYVCRPWGGQTRRASHMLDIPKDEWLVLAALRAVTLGRHHICLTSQKTKWLVLAALGAVSLGRHYIC